MAAPRRVGAQTSKTRDMLLDCVEQLMLEEGYASISYRALAAKAEVTPSLVQYYFPAIDDIFLAAIRRYSDRNLEVLASALAKRADDPLHAMWEYSWDEATSALMTEFMALGNHRKSVRAAIADVMTQVRKLQIDSLAGKFGTAAVQDDRLSADAMLALITGIPKLLNLEHGVGVDVGHADLVAAFERYLDRLEPPAKGRTRKPSSPGKR